MYFKDIGWLVVDEADTILADKVRKEERGMGVGQVIVGQAETILLDNVLWRGQGGGGEQFIIVKGRDQFGVRWWEATAWLCLTAYQSFPPNILSFLVDQGWAAELRTILGPLTARPDPCHPPSPS